MEIYEAVIKRRATRKFKNTPVPLKVLEKCVNAGRLAPSAKNRQLCEYIIVDNEPPLSQVFNTVGGWGGKLKPKKGWPPEHSPKACIVILINSTLEKEFEAKRNVTACDVGLSAENIILVALEQGISSCPILSFEESGLKKVLNIPDNYDIGLVVALGYPDENLVPEIYTGSVEYWVDNQGTRHVPKRKLEDIMHRNKFG